MFNLLLNLFTIFIFISLTNSLVLDRAQLTEWYPDYAKSSTFDLATREIDSISENTFSGLVQTKIIFLHDNEVVSISETLFNDLVNLEEIYMHFNQLNQVKNLASMIPCHKLLLNKMDDVNLFFYSSHSFFALFSFFRFSATARQ